EPARALRSCLAIGISPRRASEASLPIPARHGKSGLPLTLKGRCGGSPQKGVRRQRSAGQGEGFPPTTTSAQFHRSPRRESDPQRLLNKKKQVVICPIEWYIVSRWSRGMIVGFRDDWLRAFFVDDTRSRNIP